MFAIFSAVLASPTTQTAVCHALGPAEWCQTLSLAAAPPLVQLVTGEVAASCQELQGARGRRRQPAGGACHEAALHLSAWGLMLARQAVEEVSSAPQARRAFKFFKLACYECKTSSTLDVHTTVWVVEGLLSRRWLAGQYCRCARLFKQVTASERLLNRQSHLLQS